jgi:hypothetical protein
VGGQDLSARRVGRLIAGIGMLNDSGRSPEPGEDLADLRPYRTDLASAVRKTATISSSVPAAASACPRVQRRRHPR